MLRVCIMVHIARWERPQSCLLVVKHSLEVVRDQVHNAAFPHFHTCFGIAQLTSHQLLDSPINTEVIENLLVSHVGLNCLENASGEINARIGCKRMSVVKCGRQIIELVVISVLFNWNAVWTAMIVMVSRRVIWIA